VLAVEGDCGANYPQNLLKVSTKIAASANFLFVVHRFMADSSAVRSGNAKTKTGNQAKDRFLKEFE
jgi:hypothetical protein